MARTPFVQSTWLDGKDSMSLIGNRRGKLLVAAVAAVMAAGVGVAVAASAAKPSPSNAVMKGKGVPEFGMTKSYFKGKTVNFTYTKGFYCDRHVKSAASSGCEAGANFKKAPAKNFDPLYITVPLGFTRPAMSMECPTGLVCVDHPGTIDLSRLEPALKPLYPSLTKKQLTEALKNAAVPGHDHFITTTNGDQPEWWDVKVIGVTSPATYKDILKHKSYGYIAHQIKAKNKNIVGPIDTNLFLYFGVK
jgi:hypothetical protein